MLLLQDLQFLLILYYQWHDNKKLLSSQPVAMFVALIAHNLDHNNPCTKNRERLQLQDGIK